MVPPATHGANSWARVSGVASPLGSMVPRCKGPPPKPDVSVVSVHPLTTNEHLGATETRFGAGAEMVNILLQNGEGGAAMDTKRAQIVEWFDAPKPSFPVLWVLIGAVVALIGFKAGIAMVFVGLVILGIPVAIYLSKKKRFDARPSDQQMDEWRGQDITSMGARALQKLGVEKTELVADEVVIFGPRFWDVGGAKVRYRKGNDGWLRYSPINVGILNFGANQLLCYKCALDFATGNPLSEETEEYFYRDVVSVNTKTASRTVNFVDNNGQTKSVQLNSAESFTLTTSGGTAFEVVLKDPQLAAMTGDDRAQIPTSDSEKAVAAVRKMLREKKAVPVG